MLTNIYLGIETNTLKIKIPPFCHNNKQLSIKGKNASLACAKKLFTVPARCLTCNSIDVYGTCTCRGSCWFGRFSVKTTEMWNNSRILLGYLLNGSEQEHSNRKAKLSFCNYEISFHCSEKNLI